MGLKSIPKPKTNRFTPSSQTASADPAYYQTDEKLKSDGEWRLKKSSIGGPVASSRAIKRELPSLQENIWQPMVQALLQQAGQRLLESLWSQLQERYSNELELGRQALDLTRDLLHPQVSLADKCSLLITFLESFPALSIYLDVIRKLKDIAGSFYEQDSSATQKGVHVLRSLIDLLDEPLVKNLISQEALSSIRGSLGGALDWAQWLQHLSRVSWDSPEALIKGLLHSNILPAWANELIVQGQTLHANISGQIEDLKSQLQSESAQRLQLYLEQFTQDVTPTEKLTALLHLMLDDDIISLLATHAPTSLGGTFKVVALLQDSLRTVPGSTSEIHSTLLGVEHFTSAAFIQNLDNEGGTLGQLLGGQLGKVRTALRGSASQEAAMNLLLRLTDPKKSWSDFALESAQELIALPETKELAGSLTSHFAWQMKVVRAFYQVLDGTFWSQYQTSEWRDLPSLMGAALLRDLQDNHSHLAEAATAATGLAPGLLQDVLTAVARVLSAWRGDSWSGFLEQTGVAIGNLLSQHGSLLPAQVQQAVEWGLWAARNLAKLMLLRTLWNARDGGDKFRELASDQLRELARQYADDTLLWALEKALIWLPLLPSLVKVLGTLPAMKEGQQIKWLADLLIRLYGEPSVQKHPEIARLRLQVEAITQQWLNEIPSAMLSEAILEEAKARSGNGTKLLINTMATAYSAGSFLLREASSGFELGLMGIQEVLSRPTGLPNKRRPAYLPRLQLYAVPPTESSSFRSEEDGEPLSNDAPAIGWAAAATGATFVGLVLAYRSHQSLKQRRRLQESERSRKAGDTELQQVITKPPRPDTEHANTSEAGPFLPSESETETIPVEQTLWHPGIYAALAMASFASAIYFSWNAYNPSEERPIEPISEALSAHIEQVSATLQVDLDALSSSDKEEPYRLASAIDKVCEDLEMLATDLARIAMGAGEMAAVQTSPRLDSATHAPLTLAPEAPDALALAEPSTGRRKRQVAIGTHEAQYNALQGQLINSQREFARLLNDVARLIQQIREPFEENSKYKVLGGVGRLSYERSENIDQYNRRILRCRRRLSEIRSELLAERVNLRSIEQQIEVLAPLVIQEKFGGEGSLARPETAQEVAPNRPIANLSTAQMLIQHRWQDLVIESNGTPRGFSEKDALVRAIDFCNQLIAHFTQQRDLRKDNGAYSFNESERNDFNLDIASFNRAKGEIQEKLDEQVSKTNDIPGLRLTGVEGEKDTYFADRILEIIENNDFEFLLDESSYVSVRFSAGESVNRRSFTLMDVANGEHLKAPEATGATTTVEWWPGLTEASTQELLGITAEWEQLVQINQKYQEFQQLFNEVGSYELEKYDIWHYTEYHIQQIATLMGVGTAQRANINASTVVTQTRELPAPPLGNKKLQKNYQQKNRPVNEKMTLRDIAWGIARKNRFTDHVRTKITYSGENDAGRVARLLHEMDIYDPYIRHLNTLFENAEVLQKIKKLLNIKLSFLRSHGALSSVWLDNEVLPGVVSCFKSNGEHIIFSILDNAIWEFDNLADTLDSYKSNINEFKTHLDQRQSYNNHKERTANKTLSFELLRDPVESVIEDIRDRFIKDADAATYQYWELVSMYTLEGIKDFGSMLAMLATPFGILPGLLIGLATGVGVAVVQSFIATLPDQKQAYLTEAAIAAIFELAVVIPGIVQLFSSKVARSTLTRLATVSHAKGLKTARFFKRSGRVDNVAPVTPQIEPLRSVDMAILSDAQRNNIKALELAFTNDSELAGYILRPRENCYNATVRLKDFLIGSKNQAPIAATLNPSSFTNANTKSAAVHLKTLISEKKITNVEYRGMGYWRHRSVETPSNHYVMVVTINDTKYVLDPTAAQFNYWGIDNPIIDLEQNWVKRYQDSIPRGVAKYQDHPNIIAARDTFSPTGGSFPASRYLEGGFLLRQDSWLTAPALKGLTSGRGAGGLRLPHGAYREKNIRINGNNHKITVTKLNEEIKIYSVAGDPADTVVVSAHGSFERNTLPVPAPNGMTVEFLAPHRFSLLDPGVDFFNIRGGIKPHSTLVPGQPPVAGTIKPSGATHMYTSKLENLTGSSRPGEVMNYNLAYYEKDSVDQIMQEIARNRELAIPGQSIRKFDFVQIRRPFMNSVFNRIDPTLLSVVTELKKLPNPPSTMTASFCRAEGWVPLDLSPGYTPKFRASSGSGYMAHGHVDSYDMSALTPRLISRTVKQFHWQHKPAIFESPLPANQAPQNSEETSPILDTFILAGPYQADVWRKQELWENGSVFALFEALNQSGSITLRDRNGQSITLTVAAPTAAERWTLESTLNPPTSTGAEQSTSNTSRLEGSTLDEVLKDTYPRLQQIMTGNGALDYVISAAGSVISSGAINRNKVLSWQGELLNALDFRIEDKTSAWDERLFNLNSTELLTRFRAYLTTKNISGGENVDALGILDYLLMLHALEKPSDWPTSPSSAEIASKIEGIITSKAIVGALAEMFIIDEPQEIPSGFVPFSKKGISRFLRKLNAQITRDIHISIDDSGLNRGSMARKYTHDLALFTSPRPIVNWDLSLITPPALRRDVAVWLVLLKYLDADPEGVLQRSNINYPASFNTNISYQSYDRIGEINANRDLAEGEQVRFRLLTKTSVIHEVVYEVPTGYRAQDKMPFYIAHAISLEMGSEFRPAGNRNIKARIVAGEVSNVGSWPFYKGKIVTPTHSSRLSIYSDLNPQRYSVSIEII